MSAATSQRPGWRPTSGMTAATGGRRKGAAATALAATVLVLLCSTMPVGAATTVIVPLDLSEARSASYWTLDINAAGQGFASADSGDVLVFDAQHTARSLRTVDQTFLGGDEVVTAAGHVSPSGQFVGNSLIAGNWNVPWVFDFATGHRVRLVPPDRYATASEIAADGTISGAIHGSHGWGEPAVWIGAAHVLQPLQEAGTGGYVRDVNSHGRAVGDVGPSVSALWDTATGAYTVLPQELRNASRITEDGVVVGPYGTYDTATGAVRLMSSCIPNDVGHGLCPGQNGVQQIVDLRTGAVVHQPSLPAGAVAALFINDDDQIVGRFTEADGAHGFVWDPAAGVIDLGTGGIGVGATGVNVTGTAWGTFDPLDQHLADPASQDPWTASIAVTPPAPPTTAPTAEPTTTTTAAPGGGGPLAQAARPAVAVAVVPALAG